MTCSGEPNVAYAETMYHPAARAENGLLTYECGLCALSATGDSHCDIATYKCYEETI